MDLTEQLDSVTGVQIHLCSLLFLYLFFCQGQAIYREKNQKYEILGIWREQWIKTLASPLSPSLGIMHAYLLYRLELWFLLDAFSL